MKDRIIEILGRVLDATLNAIFMALNAAAIAMAGAWVFFASELLFAILLTVALVCLAAWMFAREIVRWDGDD